MANVSNFAATTDGAKVAGTLTDNQVTQPQMPAGLRTDGCRVTFSFRGLWNADNSYIYYDVVHDESGASWICKYPQVPVGTALEEGSYWTRWADPNIEFEELYQTVQRYDARITDNSEGIANLESKTSNDYIFLGDSLAGGYVSADQSVDGWYSLGSAVVAPNKAYIPTTIPGAPAFTGSAKWLNLLKSMESTISDKDAIGHIIVFGGSNERTISEIENEISKLMDYVRSTYKNAEVKLGCLCAYNVGRYTIAKQYKKITKYGGVYVDSMTNLLCNYDYINSTDGTHPTVEGYNFYNPYILQAILKNEIDYSFTLTNNLVNGDDYTITQTAALFTTVTPNSVSYRVDNLNLNTSALIKSEKLTGDYTDLTINLEKKMFTHGSSAVLSNENILYIEKSTNIHTFGPPNARLWFDISKYKNALRISIYNFILDSGHTAAIPCNFSSVTFTTSN